MFILILITVIVQRPKKIRKFFIFVIDEVVFKNMLERKRMHVEKNEKDLFKTMKNRKKKGKKCKKKLCNIYKSRENISVIL